MKQNIFPFVITSAYSNQSINQSIEYYFIMHPIVEQRVGQFCLPHLEITKTEKKMN